MTKIVKDYIDYLEGTCRYFHEARKEFGQLTDEELKEFNEELFCCDCCGVWYESYENIGDDENICCDCFGEDGYDYGGEE